MDDRLRGLENRISELLAWRNLSERALTEWMLRGPDGARRPLALGERWDQLGWPALLEAELAEPAHEGAVLDLWLGGEGTIFLDARLVGGLNPFHREFPAGGARKITVEAVPKSLFGVHAIEPRLEVARLVVPDLEVRGLLRELALTLAAAKELAGEDVQPLLVQAIEEALGLLALPGASDEVLARFNALGREAMLLRGTAEHLAGSYRDRELLEAIERLADRLPRRPWSGEIAPWMTTEQPARRPEGIGAARERLRRRLDEIAERYPPDGRLAVCGHAHIDLAWLWPLAETRRKIRRTAASVLGLMERYPDFHFNQSSVQIYAFLREDDPALFERVRRRVAEGRWEPIGGMWVEPDCNLPSGESLARQLLYGQRFFEREFGRRSPVAWLPDCFGFSAALPQILAGGGIRYFFTQKLTWNETNRFPYDLWCWEGLDGTRLVAHSFDNPVGGYNAQISPHALRETWRNFRGKAAQPESLFTYGYGDGGGGPNAEMLERIAWLQAFPALPQLRHATIEEFFDYLEVERDELPVWVGELYFELHRGTYTTQGRLKRLHRQAEQRLYEAEAAATLASLDGAAYPKARLDDAWTTLLRNQFHDILPGSSIREVNEEAERELAGVVASAEALRREALGALAAKIESGGANGASRIVVFNPHGQDRPLSCHAALPAGAGEPFRLVTPDGREVAYQRLGISATEILVRAPEVSVPGVGYLALTVIPGAPEPSASRVTADASGLENETLRIRLASDGSLASVFDKRVNREVLEGDGNQLWAYLDTPRDWDAWDIDAGYEAGGERIGGGVAIRVVEAGPLLGAVEVERRVRSSTIIQRYTLCAGSARLDIETRIDWNERRTLLRALFPLAVRSHEATFETAYGAVARPTHRNTSWDAARFEVPAHRWADLSEAGYGVSLVNDGKYGHSANGNVLGLSLLRSPVYPDPLADAGHHEFTYSLLPHLGDWRAGGTLTAALDLNSPLLALPVGPDVAEPGSGKVTSSLGAAGSWLRVDGLMIGAIKRAEDGDGIVVRLYDPYGGRGEAEITPAFPVAGAALLNLLEDELVPLDVIDGQPIRLSYHPWQILTLRLRPKVAER